MDVFLEYLVKQKKTAKTYTLITLIILAAVIITIVSMILSASTRYFSFIFLLLAAGAIYGAWYLIGTLRIEFEYIVTNGEMDVDKIMSQRKRKRLVTVRLKDCDIIAPVNGRYKHEFETKQVAATIDASINKDQNDAYFLVVNHPKKGMIKLIFTPDKRILDNAKMLNPHNVFTN